MVREPVQIWGHGCRQLHFTCLTTQLVLHFNKLLKLKFNIQKSTHHKCTVLWIITKGGSSCSPLWNQEIEHQYPQKAPVLSFTQLKSLSSPKLSIIPTPQICFVDFWALCKWSLQDAFCTIWLLSFTIAFIRHSHVLVYRCSLLSLRYNTALYEYINIYSFDYWEICTVSVWGHYITP